MAYSEFNGNVIEIKDGASSRPDKAGLDVRSSVHRKFIFLRFE